MNPTEPLMESPPLLLAAGRYLRPDQVPPELTVALEAGLLPIAHPDSFPKRCAICNTHTWIGPEQLASFVRAIKDPNSRAFAVVFLCPLCAIRHLQGAPTDEQEILVAPRYARNPPTPPQQH